MTLPTLHRSALNRFIKSKIGKTSLYNDLFREVQAHNKLQSSYT